MKIAWAKLKGRQKCIDCNLKLHYDWILDIFYLERLSNELYHIVSLGFQAALSFFLPFLAEFHLSNPTLSSNSSATSEIIAYPTVWRWHSKTLLSRTEILGGKCCHYFHTWVEKWNRTCWDIAATYFECLYLWGWSVDSRPRTGILWTIKWPEQLTLPCKSHWKKN